MVHFDTRFLKEIGVSSVSLAARNGLLSQLMTHMRKLVLPLCGKSAGLGAVCCAIGSSLRCQFAVTGSNFEIGLGGGLGHYGRRGHINRYLRAHAFLFWLPFADASHGKSASSIRRTPALTTWIIRILRLLSAPYCSVLHTLSGFAGVTLSGRRADIVRHGPVYGRWLLGSFQQFPWGHRDLRHPVYSCLLLPG